MVGWLEELTRGEWQEPEGVIAGALFPNEGMDEIILVKDIEFVSLCEHHVLPFTGVAHVGYLPDRTVIGLSKISRLVEMYAARLQMQERLTTQVAETLMRLLEPRGVGVILEATHLCQTARGVKQAQARMVTSAMLGIFRSSPSVRQEFLTLVKDP
jgi:GTP cyclohydrolase I